MATYNVPKFAGDYTGKPDAAIRKRATTPTITNEQLKQSVQQYLTENPIQGGSTALVKNSKYAVTVTHAPYNADPTGQRDSREAIQNAINDVYALGGGSVYIPAGKYIVTYPFIELKGMVQVYGDDRATEIIAVDTVAVKERTGIFHTGSWNTRKQANDLMHFGVSDLWIRARRTGRQHQNYIPNTIGVCLNSDMGANPPEPDSVPKLNNLTVWDMETGIAIIGNDDQAMCSFGLRVRNSYQAGLIVGKPPGHGEGSGGAADNKFFGADIGGSNQGRGNFAGVEIYTSQTKFELSTSWYTHSGASFGQLYGIAGNAAPGADITAGSPGSNARATQYNGAGWRIRATKCAFTTCEAQENGGHGFFIEFGDNVFTACRGESSSYGSTAHGSAGKDSSADFYLCNTGTEGTVLQGCSSRKARPASGGARWSYYIESWFKGLTIANCTSLDTPVPSGYTQATVPLRYKDPQGDGVSLHVGNFRYPAPASRGGGGSGVTEERLQDVKQEVLSQVSGVLTYQLVQVDNRIKLRSGAAAQSMSVDRSSGQALVHMDFDMVSVPMSGATVFRLPPEAPTPVSLSEIQIIPGQQNEGSVAIEAGSRDVKFWSFGPTAQGRRYIINIPLFGRWA